MPIPGASEVLSARQGSTFSLNCDLTDGADWAETANFFDLGLRTFWRHPNNLAPAETVPCASCSQSTCLVRPFRPIRPCGTCDQRRPSPPLTEERCRLHHDLPHAPRCRDQHDQPRQQDFHDFSAARSSFVHAAVRAAVAGSGVNRNRESTGVTSQLAMNPTTSSAAMRYIVTEYASAFATPCASWYSRM